MIILGGIFRCLYASYFIIDFKENLCASAWSMTDTSLTKRLFKHDHMHRIKKDDVFGVTVSYNPVGRKNVFDPKNPLRHSNLDPLKTLSEIVTSCAPVLLDKKGRIIALTEYKQAQNTRQKLIQRKLCRNCGICLITNARKIVGQCRLFCRKPNLNAPLNS